MNYTKRQEKAAHFYFLLPIKKLTILLWVELYATTPRRRHRQIYYAATTDDICSSAPNAAADTLRLAFRRDAEQFVFVLANFHGVLDISL